MKKFTFFTLFLVLIISYSCAQEKPTTPPYLQKGDTIAILAPAGILNGREAVIQKAKELAESWGLKVVYGKSLFNRAGHFAGTDSERIADFQNALDNPNIKAIWSGRGGYGSVRLLDHLDFSTFKKHPKWIIGYSDITAFHSHFNVLGFETLHAMMGTSLGDKPAEIVQTIATFKKAIFGEKLSYTLTSANKYNRIGTIEGELIGGNLSILTSMTGSKSAMNTVDKILFIEEIGEYKYSIDRMLLTLKRAGYFNSIKGIIVGDISKIKYNSTKWGSSIEALILDVVPKKIPVLFDFPAGHEADNRALIFGRNVQVIVGNKVSSVIFED